MPPGKKTITTHLDADEQRRLKRFMEDFGYDAPANGVRKLVNRGLEDYERRNDPRQSWLLNIGIAALFWAVLAVYGTVVLGFPDFVVSGFSVLMAGIFLAAHAVQLARIRWNGRLAAILGSGRKA